MLQTSVNRGIAVLIVATILAIAMLTGCANCDSEQRPRTEAIELAMKFAMDQFNGKSEKVIATEDLSVQSERYQPSDRSWYFGIATRDRKCIVEVAVPDCEPVESAGGGDCGRSN